MGFEEEYQAFINAHLQVRTGERLRRLQGGHSQAEKMFLKQCGGLYFITSATFIRNMKSMISRMAKGIWTLRIFVPPFEFALRSTDMALT
ncbi:hypothetical protein JOC76_001891 [Neobacillus cucumis]|uniref:hypothetical protein n=1 Tax=Neobacillus cucumis TaxID=1740721 RepID=UPI001FDDD58D|nr:hypothetical protein [Neobacillus cucumis]MBM7652433.1 hypothetical protein [Neobacillus cucumis]